ncbi:hypothetical protein N9N28_00745 [Rubripirellula amarantea]|uniref:hypothetical protein n=1 Tax=Rubripirellula amarantea TaxID=2527999 RepID=UPI0011B6D0AB|nr:hypothetical protein [Rubripirellula amarantea]MDA8743133.1 hypothetical protein [Rubripirellula amarantea]
MNIPSQRFHDADDHGGILGAWKTGPIDLANAETMADLRSPSSNGIEHAAAGVEHASSCVSGGALDVDPFDQSAGEHRPPAEPEVPWPRYHPVPTRPLYQ